MPYKNSVVRIEPIHINQSRINDSQEMIQMISHKQYKRAVRSAEQLWIMDVREVEKDRENKITNKKISKYLSAIVNQFQDEFPAELTGLLCQRPPPKCHSFVRAGPQLCKSLETRACWMKAPAIWTNSCTLHTWCVAVWSSHAQDLYWPHSSPEALFKFKSRDERTLCPEPKSTICSIKIYTIHCVIEPLTSASGNISGNRTRTYSSMEDTSGTLQYVNSGNSF